MREKNKGERKEGRGGDWGRGRGAEESVQKSIFRSERAEDIIVCL